MSQEKVDRNKASKANRKKDMQKEKTKLATIRVCAVALCAAIIGWGGYSIYQRQASNKTAETIEVDASALADYQNSLVQAEQDFCFFKCTNPHGDCIQFPWGSLFCTDYLA